VNIEDLFHSPQDNIKRFAEMQVHLFRNDVSLQDYFHALDADTFVGPRSVPGGRVSINPFLAWSFLAVDKATQIFKPRKIKTDVLFSPTPYFGRKTEVRFLTRTLLGLADTGAEILCLLPGYAPFRMDLESQLTAAGRRKQVTFLDPAMSFHPLERRMCSVAGRLRGRAAFEKVVQILEPHGLSPSRAALGDFERAAQYAEMWERLAPYIEFNSVVARCHWYDLCSAVCRTGMERGKPVVTFQQGVVGNTLDVPIVASKFVAFGAPSSTVLAEANQRFYQAIGSPEPPIQYFNSGSLFDTISPLPDQFSLQTVLLIEMESTPGDPWGTDGEVQALLQLAKKLLAAKLPMRRLLIRPHPHWSDLDLGACLELVREHRDVCELSHPIWPLEEDLRRSSIAIGIWSGALTVASASGLPTIFLRTPQGFETLDLACFSPEQTLSPDEAFRAVSKLLVDPQSYAEARKVALHNSSEYYASGANAALDGPFFTSVLSDAEPIRPR